MENIQSKISLCHPCCKTICTIKIFCTASQNSHGCKPAEGCEKRISVYGSISIIFTEVLIAKYKTEDQRRCKEQEEIFLQYLHDLVMRKNKISQEECHSIISETIYAYDGSIKYLRTAVRKQDHENYGDDTYISAEIPKSVLIDLSDKQKA